MKISNLKNIGIYPNLSKSEEKRIRLLNIFCLSWSLSICLFIFFDSFYARNMLHSFYIHASALLGIISTQYLQHKQKYIAARIVFILFLIYAITLFSIVVEPQRTMEFFYFLIPLVSLLFIDKKWINNIILIICFLLFYVPAILYDFYPPKTFNPLLIFCVFGSSSLILRYSIKLNKKNEKALYDKKLELEALNEFQKHFFINISHEIRTPLTLINGNNEKASTILKDNINPELIKSFKNIDTQVHKIKRIVDDVIDLSKMEINSLQLNKTTISVTSLVTRIYESFITPFENHHIELQLHNETSNLHIEIDPLYVERAINNILNNALKYSEPHQKVQITIQQIDKKAAITITDEGVGVSKKELPKIFDRFYQVDNDINKSGGSGIGLAFSKEIIELHKGIINVDNESKKGISFTIELPISKSTTTIDSKKTKIPLQKERPNTSILDNLNENNYTILIVEDHLEMRSYIKDVLKNFRCYEANNGIEALNIIHTKVIDLIVTDYMMPKMDGYALVKQLKKEQIKTPIIMLTARTEPQTKLALLNYGINDYLHKPFHAKELEIRVKNALSLYTQRNLFIKKEEIHIDKKEESLLCNIKIYIEKNAHLNVKIIDITESFSISKSSLYRIIKAETGLTTNNFIKEIKLQLARKYSEQQKYKTIKELSFSVGYNKPDYFSEIYKKRFGSTVK